MCLQAVYKKGNIMYAIDQLKEEMEKLMEAQAQCVDEKNGVIVIWMKYKYKLLTEQIKELKSAIDWLERMIGDE